MDRYRSNVGEVDDPERTTPRQGNPPAKMPSLPPPPNPNLAERHEFLSDSSTLKHMRAAAVEEDEDGAPLGGVLSSYPVGMQRTISHLSRINETLIGRLCDKDRDIERLTVRLAHVEAKLAKYHTMEADMAKYEQSQTSGEGAQQNSEIASVPQLGGFEFSSINSANLGLLDAASKGWHARYRSRSMTDVKPLIESQSHYDKSKSEAEESTATSKVGRSTEQEPVHTTDTASINMHVLSMDYGSAGLQDPLPKAPHYKRLFMPNLIIEFAEDSPSFRRKIETLDQNVEGLRGHLQELVTSARRYCDTGNAFCEHGRQFSRSLMDLQGESQFTMLGELQPALVRFGKTLDDIQNYTETLLVSLETTFSAPMEEFVRREVKYVRKMKTEVTRSSEDLEGQMLRLLQLKRNVDVSLYSERLALVAHTRRRFELARFDLVHHLNQLETRKKFQLVERVCSALYAFLGFFHQCHTLVATLEPSMRELQHGLHMARKDLACDDRLWTARRMQLEMQLNKGFVSSDTPYAIAAQHNHRRGNNTNSTVGINASMSSMDAGGGSNRAVNTLGSSGSLAMQRLLSSTGSPIAGAADDLFSSDDEGEDGPFQEKQDKSSRNRTLRRYGSANLSSTRSKDAYIPVIAGYLWKRSNNVRKDWKRRWFSIYDGKLCYQRQADELTPTVVCEIKLCAVRATDKETDLRHTFEIISPKQRTYVLQAEDDSVRQVWVDAIRAEIEQLLTCSSSHSLGAGSSQKTLHPHQPTAVDVEVLGRLIKANLQCVDCGSPSPEWASINLGIMMCIECSGIHRSMGVHISKVRSLTLDRWTPTLLQLMERIGNEKFNKIWQARCPVKSLAMDAPRPEREEFIRLKYINRLFLDPPLDSSTGKKDELGMRLVNAAAIGDVEKVLWGLAHGASVNWADDTTGETAAHKAAQQNQLLVLELLSHNDANLDATTLEDLAPLDYAMRAEEPNADVIALLVAKLERLQAAARA